MTDSTTILIYAAVAPCEEPGFRHAADLLAGSLSDASGGSFALECSFESSAEDVHPQGDSPLVVTSLLPEIDRWEDAWPQVELRLRATYEALSQRQDNPIFICTIFRHVAEEDDHDLVQARRIRIRQLNLLATELSRELGIYIIDIDRALADIGARALHTDYRLQGPYAAAATAKSIALTLVSYGLDAHASKTQDAAKEILSQYDPPRAAPALERPDLQDKNVISMLVGRRAQIVSPVIETAQGRHVGWLVQSLLTRKIGFREASARMADAIRRRGFRSSAAILADGIGHLVTSRIRFDK